MAAWLRSWTILYISIEAVLRRNGTDQYAVLNTPGWNPVEHPSAVVLHLRLDEIKVPGLVVSNTHVQLAGHRPVGSLGVRPERREMSVNTSTLGRTNSEGTEEHQVLFVYLWWKISISYLTLISYL